MSEKSSGNVSTNRDDLVSADEKGVRLVDHIIIRPVLINRKRANPAVFTTE